MALLKELLSVGSLNAYYKTYKDARQKKSKGLANVMFGNSYSEKEHIMIKAGGTVFTPQPIQASAYNVDPTLRGYSVGATYQGLKPFFREAMALNEKDRMQIIALESQNADKERITPIINTLFENFADFLYSVPALQAVMAGQFLSTGQIKVIDNGVDSVIDYRVPTKHIETKTSTAKWDNSTTATPLKDLYEWKMKMEEEGINLDFALMNSKTYSYILESDEFKTLVNKKNAVVLPSQYDEVITSYTGLKIVKWNETVKGANGQVEKVYPDKVVTLLPSGELGKFEFAPTPDLVDKHAGLLSDNVEVEFLKDSYATLKVSPQLSRNGALTTYGITLSSSVALNPTVIDEMVILKVAE